MICTNTTAQGTIIDRSTQKHKYRKVQRFEGARIQLRTDVLGTASGPVRIGDELMPRFVKLASLSELPEGSAAEVEFEGRVYALYHINGVVSAIDGICPHQGGPLAEGLLEGTMVTCPWHGWQFDVCTGKTPLGPKIKQPVYEVRIDGQDVLVGVP
jgi:nitrite reductase (NADH) small subunit